MPERPGADIVPQDFIERARGIANTVRHLETHFPTGTEISLLGPGREGFAAREENLWVMVISGRDWIGSGPDDGSFLASMSNKEYYEQMHKAMDLDNDDTPERHPLDMAGLFPKEWDGEQVVYEITVKARRIASSDSLPAVDSPKDMLNPQQSADLAKELKDIQNRNRFANGDIPI